jgi:hypothetical protein
VPRVRRLCTTGFILEIDLSAVRISNVTKGLRHCRPYPAFMMGIVEAGGLIPYTMRRLEDIKA